MSPGLKSVYERLYPEERFRLALGAVARDDLDDLAHLVNGCPRRAYSAPDRNYGDRIAATSEITHITTTLILSALLSLQPYAIQRELLDVLRIEWSEINEDDASGGSSEWPLQDLRARCESSYRDGLGGLLGICVGVERFCTAVKIEPTMLFATNPLGLHHWRQAISFRGEIAHDREHADVVEKLCLEIWPFQIHDESDP
jgi:hypothetical protein